jgi:hypothetical protein
MLKNDAIRGDWVCDPDLPIVDPERGYPGWLLRCPRCHGDNLHAHSVTTYIRDGYEKHTITTVRAGPGPITTSTANPKNPSPEREGLAIRFGCETCGSFDDVELTFAMGDGNVFVAWRFLPEKPPSPGFF